MRNTPTISAPISVPEDHASSTEQAGAAEDDRRDAVQVIGLSGLRVADSGPRDRQQRGDAVDQRGNRVHRHEQAPRGNAHQARRFRIVADRIDDAGPATVSRSRNHAARYIPSMSTVP